MKTTLSKKLRSTTSKQAFSDFASKLKTRWRLNTTFSPFTEKDLKQSGLVPVDQILSDLVAMPTVTGNPANHEALDYIEDFLTNYGLQVERLQWNNVESLVATTRGTKTPTVFLTGHIDVVPAPAELFELKEVDDKYMGRGVLDMKGAIAAYLGAVQQLGENVADYDFGLMIMTDEEIGGFDGAAKLAEAGYLPQVMVLPDGGTNDWGMERFAKGIWHVTIEATGQSAHGSRPWEGSNAIDTLIKAVKEVQALFPNQSPETSTINIGIIQGGNAINQIPALATASFDIRFVSLEDQQRIAPKIEAILEQHNITITTEVQADPMANDPENTYLSTYAACVEEVIGKPIKWVVSNAANDGRFFASKGVHCAIGYPLGGRHHALDEWISKESLLQMQEIFVRFLAKTAK